MIYAHLSSDAAKWLASGSDVFAEALEWLRTMPSATPDGRVEIGDRGMYALVQSYSTQPADQGRWESHRHTIDIQYIFEGGETIDFHHPGALEANNDYVAENDVEFYQPSAPPASTLTMAPGVFVVFLAGEPHRPKGRDGIHTSVRKVVVKIDASLIS